MNSAQFYYLLRRGIIGGGGSSGGFDTDYQAVLDRSTALGYTAPSASQQTLQNTLVEDLKTAGVWDKLDVFYVFATDGDSDFATLNWKAPSSHQVTKVNSPTFTADSGFTGDGTSAYLNTSFRPLTNGNNYQANNASIGVYYNSSLSSNNLYLSAYRTSADTDETFLRAGGQSPNVINNNNASNRDAFSVVGDFAQIHRNSSNQYLFTNGIETDSLAITGSNSLTDFEVYLLGLNNGGSIAALSNAQINFFYLGSTLISESSDFYNSLNTYKSAL